MFSLTAPFGDFVVILRLPGGAPRVESPILKDDPSLESAINRLEAERAELKTVLVSGMPDEPTISLLDCLRSFVKSTSRALTTRSRSTALPYKVPGRPVDFDPWQIRLLG